MENITYNVVVPPEEETSIILEGNFEQNTYSKNLRLSFYRALAMDTKIPDWVKFLPGMSGRKYRYLINNLISLLFKSNFWLFFNDFIRSLTKTS